MEWDEQQEQEALEKIQLNSTKKVSEENSSKFNQNKKIKKV